MEQNKPPAIKAIDFVLDETETTRLVAENETLKSQLIQAGRDLAALYRVYHASEYIRTPGYKLFESLENARKILGMPPHYRLTTNAWRKLVIAYCRGARAANMPVKSMCRALGVKPKTEQLWERQEAEGHAWREGTWALNTKWTPDVFWNRLLVRSREAAERVKLDRKQAYRDARDAKKAAKNPKPQPTPPAEPARPDPALDALYRYRMTEDDQ